MKRIILLHEKYLNSKQDGIKASFFKRNISGYRIAFESFRMVDFRMADVSFCHFAFCDLSGCNFEGAKIKGLLLFDCSVDGIKGLPEHSINHTKRNFLIQCHDYTEKLITEDISNV